MSPALLRATSDEHGAPAPRAGVASTGDRAAGALGTYASNPSDDAAREEKRRESRARRYALRNVLWDVSNVERCRKCGLVPHGQAVGLRIGAGGAGFSGLTTCGSVWACPVCAAKIARRRADELGQVLSWATNNRHGICMVTLTMRHHTGDTLARCWDAATEGWSRVTSGAAWAGETQARFEERLADQDRRMAEALSEGRAISRFRQLRRRVGILERYGVLGFARALEVTHGPKGWHVHLHVVVVTRRPLGDDESDALGAEMHGLWSRGLNKRGFTTLRNSGGLKVSAGINGTEAELAAYLAKQLAVEATAGAMKQGRRTESRTPFQILTDVEQHGSADDLDHWHEWERASGGRKQLTWSRDLRRLAGLAEEQSDEEVADEEVGNDDLVVIGGTDWRRIAPIQASLLTVAETGGLAAALTWLSERLVCWTLVGPPGARQDRRPSSRPAFPMR